MKYLIVEPKVIGIAPNIALMKWARWCENNGHEYQYIRGMVKPTIIPDKILMSCIFTYYSKTYEKTIDYYIKLFPNAVITIGGVFPTLYPEWFEKKKWQENIFFDTNGVEIHKGTHNEIENLIPKYNINILYEDEKKYDMDKIVLYSSRGCINKCKYCAVPSLEGKMHSFPSIKHILEKGKEELPLARSIVLYDNNFTAHEYFDNIIDELKDFGLPVDIHGLHVSSFTEHHAERFAELKWAAQKTGGTPYLRFSFDWLKYYKHIDRALGYVVKYNIKAGFFCYMLFNWTDSPDDFWKRIVLSQKLVDKHGKTIFLFPQRFEPFISLKRNEYIGDKWSKDMIRGITRMYTFIHGFMPVTKTRNIFRWIGYNKEEFFERALKMATEKNYRLIKKEGVPPKTENL